MSVPRRTPANQSAPEEHSEVHESPRAHAAAESDGEEQPTRLFTTSRRVPTLGVFMPPTQHELDYEPDYEPGALASTVDPTEYDLEPPVQHAVSVPPPLPSWREVAPPAAAPISASFPSIPAPLPPSSPAKAKASRKRGRAPWFVVSLAGAAVFSTIGTIGLLRFGGPEHEVAVHSLAGVAPVSADSQTMAGASEPVSNPRTPPAKVDCVEPRAAAVSGDVAASDDANATKSAATRQRSHTGTLRLRSSVPAAVYIDGKYAGNTPLRGLTVRAGRHKIALENAVMNQRTTLSVYVKSGATVAKQVDLDIEP